MALLARCGMGMNPKSIGGEDNGRLDEGEMLQSAPLVEEVMGDTEVTLSAYVCVCVCTNVTDTPLYISSALPMNRASLPLLLSKSTAAVHRRSSDGNSKLIILLQAFCEKLQRYLFPHTSTCDIVLFTGLANSLRARPISEPEEKSS